MSFYRACHGELDQGDLVDQVPWGMVEPSVTICRPEHATAPAGRARYAPIAQVDRPFCASNDKTETVHARAKCGRVIVLWHGCEIDKAAQKSSRTRAFVAVAPIRPLVASISNKGDRDVIREGERTAFFHLPSFDDHGESFVDLRRIWNVPQAILTHRRAALGPDALRALHGHLYQFLTRRKIPA